MTTNVPVKIKLVGEFAKMPEYTNDGAVGADLFASAFRIIPAGEVIAVPTGVWPELPDDYEIQVRSKSGLARNHYLQVMNSPGTIDPDYRGEIIVLLHNASKADYNVMTGDKIAQMVVAPRYRAVFEQVEELTKTERGEGGFGSTGR